MLAREVGDRRVKDGWLGCPNCGTDYPVREGIADLRVGSGGMSPSPYEEEELALKIVALAAVRDEKGYLVIDEPLAAAARGIAELAPDMEVIVLHSGPASPETGEGASHVMTDGGFPLVEYRLRGVAIASRGDSDRVGAAARRVGAGGRLVLFDAEPEDSEAAERQGLQIIAREGRTAVAGRTSPSLFPSTSTVR